MHVITVHQFVNFGYIIKCFGILSFEKPYIIKMNYLVPIFIILIFIYAFCKKTAVYNSFSKGLQNGLKTIIEILPCIVAITIFIELFNVSGLKNLLCTLFSPVFRLVGVPEELFELVLIRPFSGSASTALFSDLINTYGADSYAVKCASVIMGSSETVFYVTAVYFSGLKVRKLGSVIPISLICSILSTIGACALCRII